jgi:hypothetical protein
MVTVIHRDMQTDVPGGRSGNGELWLPAADLEQASGWLMKAEGFCKGEICVPIPDGSREAYVSGGDVNAAALWKFMHRPVLHDEAQEIWVLGEGTDERAATLESLEAPDFRLPDLSGRMHALSDYRGRKVFLVSWASW